MNTETIVNAPSMDSQFPLEFRNGFRIATIGFWCHSCKTAIPLTAVHGHVSRILEGVADITAASACPCGEINRYRIRLRDDATYSYTKEGAWVDETAITPGNIGLFRRIRTELIFFAIRCKCYRLTRTLKKLHQNFRNTYGLN